MVAFLTEDPVDLSALKPVRLRLRHFLHDYFGDNPPAMGSWEGYNRDFSLALGQAGYLGMAVPQTYGGTERGVLERYVVVEELLAYGAPVASHWVADRQIAPMLMRFGTEQQKQHYLPRIARGELCFAIGMSEPDSGSDLASVRTRATPVEGGWRLNGRKIWSSNALNAEYMVATVRTASGDKDRHAGLTQLLLDLSAPGISISAIRNLAGDEHFSEVVFEDVFVETGRLVGSPGGGWNQVVSELAFERSGPDRFLSTFRLVTELVRVMRDDAAGRGVDETQKTALGALVARLWSIRRMSMQVTAQLAAGKMPNTEAALVKDLGTALEQDTPEIARTLVTFADPQARSALFEELLRYDVLHTPSFSIRGGTREVMRGIIARGIGLR
jgi:alkylation response protein AidB-like acyl-CoA dehydrogenase